VLGVGFTCTRGCSWEREYQRKSAPPPPPLPLFLNASVGAAGSTIVPVARKIPMGGDAVRDGNGSGRVITRPSAKGLWVEICTYIYTRGYKSVPIGFRAGIGYPSDLR
jgi:hypothetical protein